jgi:ribosomal protein S18 acetylase RimI-like enzyme
MPFPDEMRAGRMQSSGSAAPQIEIRRLTEDDAPDFYRLRLEALEREPQAFSASPEEHRAMTIDAIAKRLGSASGDRNFVLGAIVEDRLVGMAGFYQEGGPKTRHKGHIWGVYVTEGWRGKGIARVLLSELIERVRAKPEIEQLHLAVAAGQDAAKRLYESLGFEVYGREPHAIQVGGSYMDEDLMVLHLR